jgi:hypothetical protein
MALEFNINYLSIFVAAIASFVIGFLWYGLLFGKSWRMLNKISEKQIKEANERSMAKQLIISLGTSFVMVFILSIFINLNLPVTAMSGVLVGFLIWLGFLSTTMLDSVLWDGKPFKLYLLNVGQKLFSLIVAGAILGAWT